MPRQAQADAIVAATASTRRGRLPELPLENLTLEETLRVMDVARDLRDQRQTAEEMFRRDDLRAGLRTRLLEQAKLTGDTVTAEEIDAAIAQYLETLHTYQDPPGGMKHLLALAWVERGKLLLASVVSLAAAAGGLLWFLS